MTRSPIAQATHNLQWLTRTWHNLQEARLKGTPRTYLTRTRANPPNPTTDTEATTVHGKPAPLHLDVLDCLIAIQQWADNTTDTIAQLLGTAHPPLAAQSPDGTWHDIEPRLTYIAGSLDTLQTSHIELLETICREADHHAGRAADLLGYVTTRIPPFDCPHCAQHRTLRIMDDPRDGLLIACMSRACYTDRDLSGGYRWHGRIAWKYPWTQLAEMVAEKV